MKKTISATHNFYHGLLLGILGFKDGWSVMSNREAGNGFSDIMIDDADYGIVIEVKYSNDGSLETECKKALEQIIDQQYTEYFKEQGVKTILKYGIACRFKECKVMLEKEEN